MQQQVLILTKEQQRVQARLGEPLPEFLRRRYIDDGRTLDQLGEELGYGPSAISRWLAQMGIEARPGGKPKAAA